MSTTKNRNCPLSEDFFYWPPEEIAQYKNWCEVNNLHHKRRLKKAINSEQLKSAGQLPLKSSNILF